MIWQLPLISLDLLSHFSALLGDPVYHGIHVPKGKGQPVLLIPGFLGGDWTLIVMAGWLRRIGYRPYLSGIDFNIGHPHRTGTILGKRLAYIVKETESPVIAVGHSLGGMLARFLGSHFPAQVRHVIALGSPIRDPLQTAHPFILSLFFTLQTLQKNGGDVPANSNSAQHLSRFLEKVSSPLAEEVGFTSIFTKQDEVIDWRACIDPAGDNREVTGGHVSLVVNRQVYRILAHVFATSSQEKEASITI